MSNSSIHVFRKIKRTGVEIKIKKKKYLLRYPAYIWNKFPKSLHRTFADSVTYIATWHLPLVESSSIIYHFPHPPIESIFFKMLLYSIPMNIFEEKSLYTSELLKNFYNANFQTQFRGLNFTNSGKKVKKQLKEKAILLFSIGKDSLLTYGLLKELAVTPILVFMREPQSAFENAHKKRLADKFYKNLTKRLIFFLCQSVGFGKR